MVLYTALVVDDSKVARFAMSELLKGRGFNVDAVASGEAALRYLEHHKPDIVFMDIMMPGMGGIEAARAILSQKATCPLPVIMCTGQAAQAERSMALKEGAREILIKPVAGENLDRVLRMLAIDSGITRAELSVGKPSSYRLGRKQTDNGGKEESTLVPQELEAEAYTVAHEVAERVSGQLVEILATEVARRVARETAEVVSYRTANKVLEAAQELAERKAKMVTEMILVQASLEVASKAEETVKATVRTASAQAVTECLKQQQDSFHKMLQEAAEQNIKAAAEKQVAMAFVHYLQKLEKKRLQLEPLSRS
jgi:CheY-like chemotaxis protein